MVTGGTGYLGSWVVKTLLEKGYIVRLAMRNTKDQAKTKYLFDIAQGSPGSLELWEANLLREGDFNEAAKGCIAVIHMASPFNLRFNDPQKDLVEPALKGTQNVLNAATLAGSVKRVILTSSVAAIHGDNIDMKESGINEFTEEQFNSSSSLNHQPYSFSKITAEKEAWKIYNNQEQWRLVVINPSLVMGPPLGRNTNSESLVLMKDMLTGKYRSGAPDLMFGFVDVRDVAQAHALAMENDQAQGRYLLAERVMDLYGFSRLIKSIYGKKYKLPLMKAPKFLVALFAPAFGLTRKFVQRNVGHHIKLNNNKSREQLHLTYTPLETTVKDMIERMEVLGMI